MMDNTKIPKTFKPKWIAQLCPNCRGHKTVSYGSQNCPTCEGKGYLEVPIKEEEEK